MELQLVLRFVRRWWWLIPLPALIVLGFTLTTSLGSSALPPTATTQFKYTAAQVESNLPPRDGDYQDVWLASELTVNAFTEWVRSSTFRQELVTVMGEGTELSRLSIATDNARSIGQVFLSYPDTGKLQQIADAAIVVLQTRNHLYFPHLGDTPAVVTVLDAPFITLAPTPITNRFEPLIRLGLALLGGLLLALLLEALDTRVRDTSDIERLGLRIISRIPRH